MEPLKLGVIGCGVIGNSHLKIATASPSVEVVAVADLIDERVRAAAEEFEVPASYPNDVELLADERVEAVVLAMPTGDRTPVALGALQKGKHVLIEKPAASRVDEIEKMIAMRGELVVACCSARVSLRADAEAAAECVASGRLGKIRTVRVRAVLGAGPKPRKDPPPWRQSMQQNGGGILVNWGCYDLDYVMYITGWRLRPRVVVARWWPVGEKQGAYVAPGSDADSHYTALILCEDDVALSIERAEFAAATTDQVWEIIGAEGSLHMPMGMRGGKPNEVILDRFVPGEGVASETVWEKGEGGGGGGGLLEDFVLAVREGREPRTTLERALVMQRITNGIYDSAESGRAVEIE